MGVVYLLLYIAGGGLLALGVTRFLDDVMAGEPLWTTVRLVCLGAGLICAAGSLHTWVARRRDPGGSPTPLPRMGRGAFAAAGVLWAAPILWGWVQFERFDDPIWMVPHLTLLGGLFLVFCVCTHVMTTPRTQRVATAVAVACVGLPLGLLGAALPIRHFNHHLSDVVMVMRDPMTRADRSVTLARDDVEMPVAPLDSHDNLLEMARALGEARRIDVEAELAAGRMKQLEDGTYVFLNPDGTHAPVGGAEDFEQALEEAGAADKRQAAEAQAARGAAWERELRQRKQGGRLFTRASVD